MGIFVWRGFAVSTPSLCWPVWISHLSCFYSLCPFSTSPTQLTRLWVATLSYRVTGPSFWWLDGVAHYVVSVEPTIYRFGFKEYPIPAQLRFLFQTLRLYSLSKVRLECLFPQSIRQSLLMEVFRLLLANSLNHLWDWYSCSGSSLNQYHLCLS